MDYLKAFLRPFKAMQIKHELLLVLGIQMLFWSIGLLPCAARFPHFLGYDAHNLRHFYSISAELASVSATEMDVGSSAPPRQG